MTKKDYELIAGALYGARGGEGNYILDSLAGVMYIGCMEVVMKRTRKPNGPTYTARSISGRSAGRVWYSRLANGNLIGELPLGSRPLPLGQCGTLDRKDHGDPFEHALFVMDGGDVISIDRDPVPEEGR